jgi:hypothetical protein
MSGRGTGGGGHATAGGVDFQALTAAWLVVGMLAETEFEPPWGWPREVTIESVRSETGEAVDDIWVRTSGDGRAYIQAKRSLSLEEGAESEFGKTMAQFGEQFLLCRDRIDGRTPLDPEHDRLVLAVGTQTSAPIRQHLRAVVDRVHDWPADRALTEAPANDDETRALRVTTAHLGRAFTGATGEAPSDEDLRRVMSLMRVATYEFGDADATEREALNTLRTSVVQDTGRAGDAWNALCRSTTTHTAGQSGTDRRGAQRVLRRERIAMRAPRSYRDDIGLLTTYSDRTLGVLEGLSDIALRGGRAKIARAAPGELEGLLTRASSVVVGDPGAGKSATMYELDQRLQQGGADLVALAADRLDSGSLGALRTELNLERDIVDVLANWPTEHGVLLVDALDAARGDRTQQALLDLLEETRRRAPHWTVVASIRRYDLRYNQRLKQLFPVLALPAAEYVDPEFIAVNHLSVALLSGAEIAQLKTVAPDVHRFLATASESMWELIRNPFNLRLLAQLIDALVDPAELHPIRTQLELLNSYWDHRVLTPADGADLREALLRRVCDLVVDSRSMRLNRADLQADAALLPAPPGLLSSQLLVESQAPQGAVDRTILGFGHHVLFDYAGARLLLRRPAAQVVDRLVANPDLPVLIRPSLDLHLRWLWESDPQHREFWDLTLAIASRRDITEIATLVGTGIAAEMARTVEDVAPVLDAITDTDGTQHGVGERVLAHILASVQTLDQLLVGDAAGPWTALAARLSDT